MIHTREIAGYIPSTHESNLVKISALGVDEAFLREKIGVLRTSRKSAKEETSDLCVKAFEQLQAKMSFDQESVDCVVVCTQNPDFAGLPHCSAIVHGKLNLPESCAAFDIGLGCSGYVYALSIVTSFMQANQLKNALLFTADPYSKIIDEDDKNTSLLFGDAATVTWLADSGGQTGWTPRAFMFSTRGQSWDMLKNQDGGLQMNGRAVFNFCIKTVPAQIRLLLEKAQLNQNDIDLFLMHQGSKYIVDQLVDVMGLDPRRVPFGAGDYGNTVSSSIPLLLEPHLHNAALKRIVLCGFGVGLSSAGCLLARKEEKT